MCDGQAGLPGAKKFEAKLPLETSVQPGILPRKFFFFFSFFLPPPPFFFFFFFFLIYVIRFLFIFRIIES